MSRCINLVLKKLDTTVELYISNFTGNAYEGRGSFQTMMLIRNLCKERGKEDRVERASSLSVVREVLAIPIYRNMVIYDVLSYWLGAA